MRNQPLPVQAPHLERLCREQTEVVMFLVNGIRLCGVLSHFDNHSLLLSQGGTYQLIYKHAVSTIAPAPAAHRAPSPPDVTRRQRRVFSPEP